MKRIKFTGVILVCLFWMQTPLWGQNEIRDSLIDEMMCDFLSEYSSFLEREKECMIFARSFPDDYDLKKCMEYEKISIADYCDKKTIRKLKRTKRGIPMIYFRWEMTSDGSILFRLTIRYAKIKKKQLYLALSDGCVYRYTYSEQEKKWVLLSKKVWGV